MKKFLYSHSNLVIGVLAIVLIATLVSFYIWAINDVVEQVNRALVSPPAQTAADFNLSGVANLDFRGLINGITPAPTTTPVSTPTSVIVPTSKTTTTVTSSITTTVSSTVASSSTSTP